MRDYLFRGKNSYSDRWVYGSLIHVGDFCCILPEDDGTNYDYPYLDADLGVIDGQAIPVIPETVGQCINNADKNGKKVFEGDIVETKYGRRCIVVYFASQVYLGWDLKAIRTYENLAYTSPPTPQDIWLAKNLKVIGNVHDNPELLKGD